MLPSLAFCRPGTKLSLWGAALALFCAVPAQAFTRADWMAQVAQFRLVAKEGQRDAVDRWVHQRVTYAQDPLDYWQTPLETLTSGEGDCEDFAIAKYAMLTALGWTAPGLRLAYARTTATGRPGGEPHMVALSFGMPADPARLSRAALVPEHIASFSELSQAPPQQEGDPLVLDSLSTGAMPLSQRPDLGVVFTFSWDTLWKGLQATPYLPSAKVKKWQKVVLRMEQEGTAPSERNTPQRR